MYTKKFVAVSVALLLLIPALATAKKIERLNVSPLIKGGVSSVDQLKKLVQKNQVRIQEGFAAAGAAELFPAFLDAVNNAPISEIQIAKGQTLPWMLFYSNGKSKVIQNVEWDGRKPFDAFTVVVPGECKEITFVIPKKCGNVSLLDEKPGLPICALMVSTTKVKAGETFKIDVSGSKCADKIDVSINRDGRIVASKTLDAANTVWETSCAEAGDYVISAKALNAAGIPSANDCQQNLTVEPKLPPVCDLKATPTSGYVGKTFTFDASNSSDKDGQVVKAEFTLKGKDGGTYTDTEAPFTWDKTIKKSDHYAVEVKVTDNDGLVSTNSCTIDPLDVQKRLYAVVEAGPMVAKGTYTFYGFARAGLAYLIVPEKLDLLLTGGYAFKIGDSHRHKSHFISNLILIAHMNKFFVGGGIGYTSRVRTDWKAGLDVVGNVGYEMFRKFNMVGSIFGEARLPVRSELEIKDAHEFLLGFRLLF
jgi:hypothetical protein